MKTSGLPRIGVLDLISAIAFLAIWLLRDRFEYDTLRALLLWPVVFEMYLAIALFLAGWSSGFGAQGARWVWCSLCIAAYLGAAWLTGASADTPQIWTIALWLLIARAWPPPGLVPGSQPYLEWLQLGAGLTGMLWGAGFVLTMVLVLVVPGQTAQHADGSVHSTSPAWIFPLVWTPYFVAEALIRAWRESKRVHVERRRARVPH